MGWTICKSFAPRSKQITMSVPHHSLFYRPDALPATQPKVSKKCVRVKVVSYKYTTTTTTTTDVLTGKTITVTQRSYVVLISWKWYTTGSYNWRPRGNNMWSILTTLIQPKTTYCLSTFRLHIGSLHQDWLPVPVISTPSLSEYNAPNGCGFVMPLSALSISMMLIVAALCNMAGHYTFALWFLSIYLSMFFVFLA